MNIRDWNRMTELEKLEYWNAAIDRFNSGDYNLW